MLAVKQPAERLFGEQGSQQTVKKGGHIFRQTAEIRHPCPKVLQGWRSRFKTQIEQLVQNRHYLSGLCSANAVFLPQKPFLHRREQHMTQIAKADDFKVLQQFTG